MPSDKPTQPPGRRLRIAIVLCLLATTALALFVPSDSLRATLVTILVVFGLVYAGWRLSVTDDERAEPLPADD